MPKLTLIGLYFWICLAQKVVSGDDLYHEVGGDLLLTPDKSTVPDPITSILWKHGKNKVAEWDKDFGGLDIYAAFINRTTLDQTTGELRITGLKKTDSGVYYVEFNSKLLDKTYTISVIKPVPKPTITSSCNPDKTSCILTCEGDTTDAEPVTYSWKVGEGAWQVIGKQLIVSKNYTGKPTNSYKYICKMKNSVSGEVSEVFGLEPVPKPTITSSCNPDKPCILTCEGDTTGAEPVTYSWKVGEGAWEVIGKQLIVSKNYTGKTTNSYKYICKMKNSVSGEVSEVFGSEPVPKPTITYTCNSNKTSCILTCEGDTTGAEPVTYSWKVGEGAWEVIGKQLIVSKSDTGKSTNSYKYFCKMKNSAGEGDVSEPVGEVFGSEPSEVGVVVVGVVVTIVALVIVIIGFLVRKKITGYPQDTRIDFLRKYCGGMFGKFYLNLTLVHIQPADRAPKVIQTQHDSCTALYTHTSMHYDSVRVHSCNPTTHNMFSHHNFMQT
uniref:Ig-like domain-containing protein n=1 Tax=Salmo trutta TaxID=8032 RepID=A0A674AMX1_SALTR